MANRYAIWDKVSQIITPVGEVFEAEQWMARYPVARVESIKIVCAAGEINGGFFGVLSQMKAMWEQQGVDFSACTTDEEILAAIEAAEDESNAPSNEPTTEERTATALEAIASGQTTENVAAMNALLSGEE